MLQANFKIYIILVYIYPTPVEEQDAAQGQFFAYL